MKKEKTLYEKRISWHEEGISYNGEVFEEVPLTNGDKILREKDVKQFIKEILDEIEKKERFHKKYKPSPDSDVFIMELNKLKQIIKQKAGFEELE